MRLAHKCFDIRLLVSATRFGVFLAQLFEYKLNLIEPVFLRLYVDFQVSLPWIGRWLLINDLAEHLALF